MPTYRVISEPLPVGYPLKENIRRRLRGDAGVRRAVCSVNASDALEAIQIVSADGHSDHAIISVEELIPAVALYVSNEELIDLLRQDNDDAHDQEPLHPGDYDDDETIFGAADFNSNVELVAAKLSERFLPGMFLTIVSDMDGDHALIQMRDEATGIYLAKTADMDDLTLDTAATGWNGILSIAGALITQAQELV